MKFPRLVLAILLLGITAAQADTTTADLFTEAQRAYLAGKTDVAKAKFQEVLAAEPNHTGAKNYLRLMAATSNGEKSKLAGDLEKLILPKVAFKDASMSAVLEYLKTKSTEISEGKITPSFVLQLPPNYADHTSVTLNLANVPFTEVLRYLGELTATKFEIQSYAIVCKPR